MTDLRLSAPSSARNRAPILTVLKRVLPQNGKVLEIASGAGEHAVYFAGAMPGLVWQPSDPDPSARASISEWIKAEGLTNVRHPLDIDVRAELWGVEMEAPYDAIVAINMIHIAPWAATLGLFAGAARLLRVGGIVYLYGPYRRNGRHTAPSNEAFEQWLKEKNPEFGVRDLDNVSQTAERNGLVLRETVEMPANNLSVIYART